MIKNIFLTLIVSLVFVAIFDILDRNRLWFYNHLPLNLWKIKSPKLVSEDINITIFENFDKDLGWDKKFGPISDLSNTSPYIAQAYGNSFVESSSDLDGLTWQQHFEKISGYGILNLGTSGYGLDQSILKFEKYHNKYKKEYKTKISILGLYSEQIRRSLSYHSYYYFTGYEHFKVSDFETK